MMGMEQSVRDAIERARSVYREPGWVAWADGWLSGADRSAKSAWAARQAAGERFLDDQERFLDDQERSTDDRFLDDLEYSAYAAAAMAAIAAVDAVQAETAAAKNAGVVPAWESLVLANAVRAAVRAAEDADEALRDAVIAHDQIDC